MTTIYEVLRRPLITEKSNYQSGKLHQYTFEVLESATKTQIKDAVETLFDVKVLSVNTVKTAAKRGRRPRSRRLLVRRSGYKKAVITLAPGDTLPMFEGIQ
jgi:large subunit ribosomal protein L23